MFHSLARLQYFNIEQQQRYTLVTLPLPLSLTKQTLRITANVTAQTVTS